MTEHNICTDCELRHIKQEKDSELLVELHKAIIGDIHNPDELSLCTKINILYEDFENRKNLIKTIFLTSLGTIIGFVFWCGYQYHILTIHTEQIDKLEVQMLELQRHIRNNG